jgi:hypothetical protein
MYCSKNWLISPSSSSTLYINKTKNLIKRDVMVKKQIGKMPAPFVASVGQIMDKEVMVTSQWPSITSWIGIVTRFKALKDYTLGSVVALNKIKSQLKTNNNIEFSKLAFLQEAKDIYLQLNTAIANGDESALRNIVTDVYFKVGLRVLMC